MPLQHGRASLRAGERMKTVFSSNEEVCHIWAQQTQSGGRANNVFFRDSVIFSYGEHFPMAKIHTVKGKRVALINSKRYSVTTEQHKNEVRSALRGLMPAFDSTDIYDLKAAVAHLDTMAKGEITAALKRMKIERETTLELALECIDDAYNESNELRKLLGRAPIQPKKADLDAVEAHLRKRLARYHELNTPEMRAKRDVERSKRDAREKQREQERQVEAIKNFRLQGIRQNSLHTLSYDLLRVEGDSVVTSRGAVVPLAEARQLYEAIVSGKPVQGARCGSYTVNSVEDCVSSIWENDKRIQIGCHTFYLSEARQVLEAA